MTTVTAKTAHGSSLSSLKVSTCLAYALPAVPLLLLTSSLNVVQGIYAEHYGLALTTVSLAMMIAGLFDAVTDPLVGYWSDRYHARTGSRRPFVIGGALLALPCAWFLFLPSGNDVSVAYFVFWYMAFYLAVTALGIPHIAWAGELSTRAADRNRIFGFKTLAGYVGLILYACIPMLPLFATSDITPETMRYSVLACGALLLPCLYILWKYVPTGVASHETAPRPENPFKAIRALLCSRPFLLFVVASTFFGVGLGVFYGLLFIVTGSYLGLGEHYVYLSLFHLAVATLMVRPAVWLCDHLGKRHTWGISVGLGVICSVPVSLLLVEKGPYSLALLYCLQFLLGTASTLGNIASPSLFNDIIDYDTLKTGIERRATCFAVQSFLGKVSSTTLGFPLGVGLVGLYGFDPANPVFNDDTLFGFKLAMGWLPAGISLIALGLVFLIPLNAKRRRIIRKRLDQREARQRLRRPHIADTSNASSSPFQSVSA